MKEFLTSKTYNEGWSDGYKKASMDLYYDGWTHALKNVVKMIDKTRAESENKAEFDTVMQFIEELK